MLAYYKKPFFLLALCFLSGSLCALGMAPYNLWPVFFVGFGVLYLSIDCASNKKWAFLFGWTWAFSYFLFSLYWIGNALLVEGNPYKWAWPLAVCGLPALLAFFNSFACLFIKAFLNLKRWHGYLGFVSALSLSEWLRGHVFTGFPWNLYGYAWSDLLPIAQLASFDNVYFLTFATLFWMSIPGFWVMGADKFGKRVFNILIIVSFLLSFQSGANRLKEPTAFHKDILVKVMQPNTPQHEKWQREKMDGHFRNALKLSRADERDTQKTLIVWPETTISPNFLNSSQRRQNIASILAEYPKEALLLTGALRYQDDSKTYHNSLISINKDGKISRTYDKSHLVPFGEYIPFKKWIPLAPVVQFQGFQKGKGLEAFEIFDGLKYSPLVCYEVIFPGKSVPPNRDIDFIVNVTNDAWYGDSPGPHQHLIIAKFRAIEEGIPVIRAANTGISSVVDSHGRILVRSKTFTQNILNSPLPQKLSVTKNLKFSFPPLFPTLPVLFLVLGVLLYNFKLIGRLNK